MLTVFWFSFREGWREEPNLPEVINGPAMTGYEPDKTLYIIGGKIKARDSNSVRVLTPETSHGRKHMDRKWEFGPYLPEKISGAHALFLDHAIYVFGGTSNKQILRYSPKTDNPATWHKYGQLKSKLQYLGKLKNSNARRLNQENHKF